MSNRRQARPMRDQQKPPVAAGASESRSRADRSRLRLEWVESASLTPNPANWRRHPAGQLSAIKGVKATRATGSSFSLSNGATVTLKCVIGDDPGNSALQELKVYVAGTLRLTTTAIDDTWPGGHVGVWRANLHAPTPDLHATYTMKIGIV
ncbi:MAG: hypothetical protein JNG88_14160 [Phycisphaerales bacterium]|nr:hypothetical protein [Phycisphaerales bacterium]